MNRQTAPPVWLRSTAVLTIGLALGAACGDDSTGSVESIDLSDDATIEYVFTDSSVPPEFHRSYTLTIESDDVHAVVDSYGDEIGETSAPVTEGLWGSLALQADEMAKIEPDEAADGCAGGTKRDLTVVDRDETVIDLSFSVCEGNEDQAARVDAYIDPVIAVIPDWDSVLDKQEA